MHEKPYQPALIEPSSLVRKPSSPIPERAVMCFFPEIFDELDQRGIPAIHRIEVPEHAIHPLWKLEVSGTPVVAARAGLGAPLSVIILELLIALGIKKIVVCGGAGALDPSLTLGHVVVVHSALSDEGTSKHYMPDTKEFVTNPSLVKFAVSHLQRRDIPFVTGKTWTTDAFFRETPNAVARKKKDGCVVVEMEASALLAVAQFRHVGLLPILYAGDDVSGETWQHRNWDRAMEPRHALFDTALELAARIP
jgi:uridine phosphorylase